MCGIAGIYVRGGAAVDREALRAATGTLAHRGPDDSGFYLGPGIGLGHRRLSVIDVEGGHQPIGNEDGSVQVVFNGEIYNFRELRSWLVKRGHRFRTSSDTEVIAHLYEESGQDAIEALFGMFALAIWDERRRRLVLARDRVGKKPLYYHWDGNRVVFGSELKAVLEVPDVPRRVDPDALDCYLSFGYVPAPHTIYAGISKLLPGHHIVFDDRGARSSAYWTLRFPEEPTRKGLGELVEEFEDLLDRAVASRLVSDVPLGGFLSGGIDSSLVAWSMRRNLPAPPRTFTVGFDARAHDESPEAEQVARHLGTRHTTLQVEADPSILPDLVQHFDEPFADSSAVPMYWLSRAARERVTVVLSGDGGDEAFGGYANRYPVHLLEQWVRRLFPAGLLRGVCEPLGRVWPTGAWLPRPLRAGTVLENLTVGTVEAYFRDVGQVRPERRPTLMHPDVRATVNGKPALSLFRELFAAADRAGAQDPLARLMYVDLYSFLSEGVLVKVDRMSMAHGLEVRCPLLDHRILEFAAALPWHRKVRGFTTKVLLRQTARRHLPASIARAPKRGFDHPRGAWLKGPLRPLVENALSDPRSVLNEYFDVNAVRRSWQRLRRGTRDESHLLWTLLVLDLWARGETGAVGLDRHAMRSSVRLAARHPSPEPGSRAMGGAA